MIENTKQTQRAQQVRAQGLAHAVAHQLSGLARQAYADKAGISVYKLDYWRTLARRLNAGGDQPAMATTTVTNTVPSVSHPSLVPMLFMEINRAADTALTASSPRTTADVTARASLCATSAALPIELHLGGAWQGHRLCLAATIDDAWLARILQALPTYALPDAPQPSAPPPQPPPRSPQPSTHIAPSRANGLAAS